MDYLSDWVLADLLYGQCDYLWIIYQTGSWLTCCMVNVIIRWGHGEGKWHSRRYLPDWSRQQRCSPRMLHFWMAQPFSMSMGSCFLLPLYATNLQKSTPLRKMAYSVRLCWLIGITSSIGPISLANNYGLWFQIVQSCSAALQCEREVKYTDSLPDSLASLNWCEIDFRESGSISWWKSCSSGVKKRMQCTPGSLWTHIISQVEVDSALTIVPFISSSSCCYSFKRLSLRILWVVTTYKKSQIWVTAMKSRRLTVPTLEKVVMVCSLSLSRSNWPWFLLFSVRLSRYSLLFYANHILVNLTTLVSSLLPSTSMEQEASSSLLFSSNLISLVLMVSIVLSLSAREVFCFLNLILRKMRIWLSVAASCFLSVLSWITLSSEFILSTSDSMLFSRSATVFMMAAISLKKESCSRLIQYSYCFGWLDNALKIQSHSSELFLFYLFRHFQIFSLALLQKPSISSISLACQALIFMVFSDLEHFVGVGSEFRWSCKLMVALIFYQQKENYNVVQLAQLDLLRSLALKGCLLSRYFMLNIDWRTQIVFIVYACYNFISAVFAQKSIENVLFAEENQCLLTKLVVLAISVHFW